MNPERPAPKWQRRARTLLTAVLTDDRVRRIADDMQKRKYSGGRPANLRFFFAFDDPYVALAIEAVRALPEKYRANVEWLPVASAYDAMDAQFEMRRAYALQDAQRELGFGGNGQVLHAPSVEDALHASRMAAALLPANRPRWVAAKIRHLWFGEAAPAEIPFEPLHADIVLSNNAKTRAKLGHYDSGMLEMDRRWYWVYGRLDFLTERLDELGLGRS